MKRLLLGLAAALAACDESSAVHEHAPVDARGHAVVAPPGSVPRGQPAVDAELDGARRPSAAEELRRGRARFDAHCAPCHGRAGYGDGIVVRHGFPPPPSFHGERLRQTGEAWFVGVITTGVGHMFSYADRVPPGDRWAVAAYIKALQLSQHAPAAALPDSDRARLEER